MSDDDTVTTIYSNNLLPTGLIDARILFVDDLNFYESFVKQTLFRHGFTGVLDYASGIQQAAAKIHDSLKANNPYKAFIIDLNLPDGKGTILSKKIRTNKMIENCPIILVSTETEKTTIIAALTDCGVDTFVLKPLSSDDLYEKIVFAWKKRNGDK